MGERSLILETIKKIAEKNPELRVGQIIVNICRPRDPAPDIFYMTDQELLDRSQAIKEHGFDAAGAHESKATLPDKNTTLALRKLAVALKILNSVIEHGCTGHPCDGDDNLCHPCYVAIRVRQIDNIRAD